MAASVQQKKPIKTLLVKFIIIVRTCICIPPAPRLLVVKHLPADTGTIIHVVISNGLYTSFYLSQDFQHLENRDQVLLISLVSKSKTNFSPY